MESGHVNSALLIQVRRLFQLLRSSRRFYKRPYRDRNPIAPVNQLATSPPIRERLMRDSIKFNDSRLGHGTVGVTPFRFRPPKDLAFFHRKCLTGTRRSRCTFQTTINLGTVRVHVMHRVAEYLGRPQSAQTTLPPLFSQLTHSRILLGTYSLPCLDVICA